jgi:S-DNA-T family DNA segregation ATPase FtsK/SpoIIIE
MSLTESSAMPRLQAAYASDDEIKAVVDFVKKNNPSNFDENAEKAFNLDPQSSDDVGSENTFVDAPQSKGKVDEYFKIAVKSVMMCGSASVSYLQRRLSIGYSRAARIVDQMEEKGYIAPPTGAKTRKVLITPEQFREEFGEEYNS